MIFEKSLNLENSLNLRFGFPRVKRHFCYECNEQKRRRGCLNIYDCQEDTRISAAEEGELSNEASTHPNVVLGSIWATPESHDRKLFVTLVTEVSLISREPNLRFERTL